LRVLDLTRVLAGPVATRFLALLGADVLRIEPPDWDEPAIVPETMLGKRTARLNFRQEDDRQRFIALLSRSDILVHGYRPDALTKLGFGEMDRQDIRPGLIEVTLDAYGWSGPWKGRRGFDSLVQMSSGIAEAGMRLLGRDRPTPLPVQALDHATGYLMAFATLSAITHRQKNGRTMRAKLSLARTSHFLYQYDRAGDDEGELAPEGSSDWNPEIEETGWGSATRLKVPVTVEGVSFHAARPAMPLGSGQASW
jgi:crotonobetainyl-CoA:carnitine CoA-transferase CaiB-like acyl-CoA transferase